MSTLEEVKAKLAEVTEKLGEKMATEITRNSGGLQKKTQTVEDVSIKKYDRIIRRCGTVLKAHQTALDKDAANKANREKWEAADKVARDEALAVIEADGAIVASLVEKIDRQHLAAANAFDKEVGEADAFKAQLGAKLIEVKPRCKAAGMTFDEFKEKYVGDLFGRSKVFEIMSVARKEITFDGIRLIEKGKKQAQRDAAKKSGTSRTKAQPPAQAIGAVKTAGGDAIDTGSLGAAAQAQLTQAMSPQASADAMKAQTAAEDVADDLLATFKRTAQALLDYPDELGAAVKWFNSAFAIERTKRAQKKAA